MGLFSKLIPPATSLHLKLVLSLALLLTLVVVGVTSILINHERDRRFDALEMRADRMIDIANNSLAYSVWNIDINAIDKQLSSLSSDPEITKITISAVGYGSLWQFSKTQESSLTPILRIQDINYISAEAGVQKIGEVRIEFTREIVEQAINKTQRVVILVVVIILISLYITTFLLLKHMVTLPVRNLEKMVNQIAQGDLNTRCTVNSKDELGRLAMQVNTMVDQLRESDEHLRGSQENLSITLDSIGDAVITTDAQGNITRMNPIAEKLTGWLQTNALGQHLDKVFRIFNSSTHQPVINPVQLVFERGEIVGMANHTVLIAKDGSEYQIADSAAPIRKLGGDIVGVVLVFSDVTEQYKVNSELAATQVHLQAILDAIPDVLFEVDRTGLVLRYHAHHSNVLAEPPEVFLGKQIKDVLPPTASEVFMGAIEDAVVSGYATGATYSLALPQGEVCFELSVASIPSSENNTQHFTILTRDVTQRKQAEAKLQLAASVFVNAGEGIIITDSEDNIIDVNQSFSDITGYSRDEVIGQKTNLLKSNHHNPQFYEAMRYELNEQGHWNGEVWKQRKNGEVYPELLTISAVRNNHGLIQQFVTLFTDITAIKAHQSQLEYVAHFDVLTKLPNRALLADRLQQAMSQNQRRGKQLAIAFLDLDGFKEINDCHTHEMGDQVLVILTERMQKTLREGDTLARLGGDEFVAVITDLEKPSDCLPLVTRLLAAAARPIHILDLKLQVSASIGITYYPQTKDIDADQLLRQADQAMYDAKVAGKNRYRVFDAAQDNNLRGYHESLERIQLALQENEFVLYYQPKVNMRTGQVIGAEALIRWMHPEKGLLAPAAFLPTIENHQLAVSVGEWVFDTALTQIEQWHKDGLNLAEVSVNVGARQLQQSDFIDRLKFILGNHPQVIANKLQIEILETSALADMTQVSNIIEECEELGIKFALDDFGTGYSSLTYLKNLNVSMLKIDQSFVRNMLDDADDLAILQGVIGLATAFKRQVIAEGVETLEHGTALLNLGCELAQGYGIAHPMPASELPAWTVAWRSNHEWSKLQLQDNSKVEIL